MTEMPFETPSSVCPAPHIERVSQKDALFFIALGPGGPRCRNATEPGASLRLRRMDPLTRSGTAPANVAYAATGVSLTY